MTSAQQYLETHFPNLANNIQLKPTQIKSIESVVVNRQSTLGIMPTGGGKSLIYWLSGKALGGMTIVISPLTALIDEQALKLQEQGMEVLVLHSGIDTKKQIAALKELFSNDYTPDFIFVSPERLATDGLLEGAFVKRKDDIPLVVIDEIHCISQWGESFRPFYTHIPNFLNNIFGQTWPTILGLSATLIPQEIEDIKKAFAISVMHKDELLMRSEINLHVERLEDEEAKEKRLEELLSLHKGEKTLVYIYRKDGKRSVEYFAKDAVEKGFEATYFHSEISSKQKGQIIQDFKDDKLKVIFATNAFGMGIDINDIRVVIHYMIPESVAQYYQEVGRASRDKMASNAYLLYSDKNIQVRKTHFIDRSFPKEEVLRVAFETLKEGRHKYKTHDYFDNENIQKCLPYFLDSGCFNIRTKAIQSLEVLENVTDPQLTAYINSTSTKNFITTIKKNKLSPETLSSTIFNSLLEGTSSCSKSLRKCLVIEEMTDTIDEQLPNMLSSQEEKRKFKYEQLDYLVYLISRCEDSRQLHQEIALYLGVPKFHLNRIYNTKKGDKVRSKSEVIIANSLFNAGIDYVYEQQLRLPNGKLISPDFTIDINSRTYYLEHVGMIGKQDYYESWLEKRELYEKYHPNQLIYTYEGPSISSDIEKVIEKLL